RRLNRLEASFYDLTVLLELREYHAAELVIRGHLRRMMGDLTGALRDVERAREQLPEWDEPHRLLALILADLGRGDEAVESATLALDLARSPEAGAVSLSYRAMAHLVAGRPADAQADAAESRRRNPSGPEAAHVLAVANLTLGRVDEGLEAARLAID